jgi:DNA-binding transcriptional LysR family regulator
MQWDGRVGRRLRLKDLHTLQTVAAVGSMAKASERLALSQPAISKAISDMEQTLGVPLFDRSSSGVELTDCGRHGVGIFPAVLHGFEAQAGPVQMRVLRTLFEC